MRICRIFILLMFCVLLSGCTGAMKLPWRSSSNAIAASKETYRQKAVDYENKGDLAQALFAWRVAAGLDPGDKEVVKSVGRLEHKIAVMADQYFKEGVKNYRKGDFTEARLSFLKTLRLDAGHQGAKYYLKTSLHFTEHEVYKVQRGDSFVKIATNVYNDPTKAFTIAYFNDHPPHKPLLIGTVLFLPDLSSDQLIPRKEVEALVEKARDAIARKSYQEALRIVDRIKLVSPTHPKIETLSNEAHYGQGMALLNDKKYYSALEQFKKVDPSYKGRDRAIRKVRRHVQKHATDEKVRLARSMLQKGDYEGVINICEEIMAQDPSGKSNKEALDLYHSAHYLRAKRLLDQGEEAKALESLSVLDRNYKDTAQMRNQARAKLNSLADDLYRRGVKHFLNEELEQAIASWEKALALNPNHPKARQDIDNALKLLDKWRDLSSDDKNSQ